MEPNPIAILVLCFGGAALLIFLFWANHKIRTGGQRKSEAATERAAHSAVGYALSYILGGAGPVNDYEEDVMSRPGETPPAHAPSSLDRQQTADRQAPDRPDPRKPTPDELLTLYRLMRKHGVPREEARAALKTNNLPLDNNLWAKAAPPEEEGDVLTPVAGRPTKASYYPDRPDLQYEPPPR